MSYHEYYKWSLNETAEGKRANPMTNETEMPERIWVCTHLGEYGHYYPEAVEAEGEWGGVAIPYVPEAISDAKDKRIAELEATLQLERQSPWVVTDSEMKRRAEAAEAKLAKAMDGLRECEGEIDQYIRNEYPHDHPVQERYRKRDFAANPARTTIAEIQGNP